MSENKLVDLSTEFAVKILNFTSTINGHSSLSIYHYKISHYSAYSNSPAKYKAEMQTLENQILQNL